MAQQTRGLEEPSIDLSQTILRQLAALPGINLQRISIAERNGAVTATGSVANHHLLAKLSRAVFRVPGVTSLVCRVTVNPAALFRSAASS